MAQILQNKITSTPTDPGVYIMKDAKGKSSMLANQNLRNRLRNYLSGSDTRRFVSLR